ncbi:hypothetical protein FJT64_026278 [Amphibalanus amphitrite]|uniref:Uncharacterized protein n=1 Tax=Amphibalanus amphitrite TaxID=1232801 RepID=A0A6A4W884_AMPAM|nr:hypothetical protein FJT64_026278 [Amphibalanus amphitrite]
MVVCGPDNTHVFVVVALLQRSIPTHVVSRSPQIQSEQPEAFVRLVTLIDRVAVTAAGAVHAEMTSCRNAAPVSVGWGRRRPFC